MDGFTYKGIHSDNFGLSIQTEPSILPPIATQTIQIPNMPGAYYQGSSFGMRPINIPVGIVFNNASDFQSRLRDLAYWLKPEDDIHDMPLVFDMESDKIYYAVLSGNTDLPKIARTGQGTLYLIAIDPFAYGEEIAQTINDPSGGPANATVTNEGSADTFPKFTINVEQQRTFLSIVSPDSAIMLGKPAAVEDTQVDEEELVYTTPMDSLSDWVTGNYVDSESSAGPGVVTGSMAVQNSEFVASSYGSGDSWHGPAIVHTLNAPITDFWIGVKLTQKSSSADQIGRAEMYLLDVNDNVLAKVAMRDGHTGNILNQGQFKVGDNTVYYGYPGQYGNWNNWESGYLQVRRKGTAWEFMAGKVAADGSHYAREYVVFYDDNGLYTADVAKIQLHLGQFGTYAVTEQSFTQLNVTKLNSIGDKQVPYIVQPGDVLEIDMDKRKIHLNGADARYLKDFTSDWFSLKPGTTDLAVYPPDIGKTDIAFTPRWL